MIYDTIAAISSPHGTGAISIIRITGELSLKIVEESLKNQKTQSKKMCFGYFYSEEKKLDEITWVFHQAPYSFTGEDMLEIFCHGGKIITEKIFQSILKKGIREAVAGEFSKRAVLNGKMDLIKAESINNLIHAKTDKSADFFSNQMNNGISSEIDKIKEFLLNQIAEIEVSMDYPDDFELDSEKIKDTLKNTLEEIENILKNSENGLIISEGIKTVIIGKPNSGKSTLLNSLLKKDRAIVTDIPGTTRDTIEEDLNISGIHIKIIDTAGIRETEDKVEKIGIEKTNKAIEESNLVIAIFDMSNFGDKDDFIIADKIKLLKDKNIIIVFNKEDITKISEEEIRKYFSGYNIIIVSAKNSKIENLEKKIYDIYKNKVEIETPVIFEKRHKYSLIKTEEFLKNAINAINNGVTFDFIMYDIRKALESLLELKGETYDEILLDKIFSSFCVGK